MVSVSREVTSLKTLKDAVIISGQTEGDETDLWSHEHITGTHSLR